MNKRTVSPRLASTVGAILTALISTSRTADAQTAAGNAELVAGPLHSVITYVAETSRRAIDNVVLRNDSVMCSGDFSKQKSFNDAIAVLTAAARKMAQATTTQGKLTVVVSSADLEKFNDLLPASGTKNKKYTKEELKVFTASPPPGTSADAAGKLAEDREKELRTFIDKLEGERSAAIKAFRAYAKSTIEAEVKRECSEACVNRALEVCQDPKRVQEMDTNVRTGAFAPGTLSGMSWVTPAVTGLTSFLTDRTEAELVLWFVDTFETQLCNEATYYFSKTCNLVSKLSVTNQPMPGAVFAASLRSDLEELPLRIAGKAMNLDALTISLLKDLMVRIRHGESPLGLLAGLATTKELRNACATPKDMKCHLLQVGEVAAKLGDVAKVYQSDEFEKQIDAITAAFNTYVAWGEETRARKFGPGHPLYTPIHLPATLDGEKLVALLRISYSLQTKLREWKDARSSDASSYDRSAELLHLTLNVMKATLDVLDDPELSKRWTTIHLALSATSEMLRGRFAEGARDLIGLVGQANVELPDAFLRYTSVVVDLATAKDAASVQAALNAAAAPVGSWRVKRQKFTASISGLVGGFGGGEIPMGNETATGSGSAGVLAALGLDLACPIGDHGWTFGPFISIIDVGQFVTVPVLPGTIMEGDNEVSAEAGGDIELAQILSPGLYLRLGAGKTPFTFGVGASIAPRLRRYTVTAPTTGMVLSEDKLTMFRFGAFMAVDITLFPF